MADPHAPTTAQAAAETLHDLKQAGASLMNRRKAVGRAAWQAEWLYRSVSAAGAPQVRHGRSDEVRKQLLLALELTPEISARADEIARLAQVAPPAGDWQTIGDLRALRDATKDEKDTLDRQVRLFDSEVRYATTVAAWARGEFDAAMGGRIAS